ncbi:MAG: serine protease, partial [Acidobacteriota bacterium]
MKRVCLIACVLAAVSVAMPTWAVEVDGYLADGIYDAEAVEQQQAELSAWLVSEQASKALQTPISVTVTAEDLAAMQPQTEGLQATSKLLVGVAKSVGVLIDLEAASIGLAKNAIGTHVWTGAVHAEGAAALRVHFSDVDFPEGAELYIYNDRGEAFGPYTDRGLLGTGDFWSHTITGETMMLQVRTPANVARTYFTIADVGFMGSGFHYAQYRQRSNEKSFCSYNADCVTANSGTDTSIAHYTFIQRPYIYMCSGGLIADEGQSGTPYFLTANHCLSRDKVAETVETYFFYTGSSNCSGPAASQTVGASIVNTNKTGDYSLLQLSATPSGTSFLGWTTEEVAYTNGYALNRVSHPQGAPQAYSEHDVDADTGTCSSWPRGSWIYSKDTKGATEGGSSGSPVLNSQGKVGGQLSGACGYNLGDVCDSVSNSTVDGAFAAYYP